MLSADSPSSMELHFRVYLLAAQSQRDRRQLSASALLSQPTPSSRRRNALPFVAMNEMQDASQLERRAGILALPTELIHNILLSLPPLCIEHFSQTCKLAREHVYGEARTGDIHLWKQLYLQRFDDFPAFGMRARTARYNKSCGTRNKRINETRAHPAPQHQRPLAPWHIPQRTVPLPPSCRSSSSGSVPRDSTGADPSNTGSHLSQLQRRAHRALICHRHRHANEQARRVSQHHLAWRLHPRFGSEHLGTMGVPRSMLHHLDEYKIESAAAAAAAANRPKSPQESKRRRLSSAARGTEQQDDEAGPSCSSPSKPGPSRRRSSSKYSSERPTRVAEDQRVYSSSCTPNLYTGSSIKASTLMPLPSLKCDSPHGSTVSTAFEPGRTRKSLVLPRALRRFRSAPAGRPRKRRRGAGIGAGGIRQHRDVARERAARYRRGCCFAISESGRG